MMVVQFCTSFQAIRKPGKKRPAVFAFWDPGPPLRDFTKNIDSKAKPSLPKPTTGLTSRGFYETDVFGASPVASALDRRPGRDPGTPSFTLACRLQTETEQIGFLGKLKLPSCRMPSAEGKTTLECQHRRQKAETGRYHRSTEFVIGVPRPSWRKNFSKEKSCQQKAEKGEARNGFGRHST
jgi:hypothetical protein